MAWGRAVVSGGGDTNGIATNGSGGGEGSGSGERAVNVLATGSVDQTVKVSLDFGFEVGREEGDGGGEEVTLTGALRLERAGLDALKRTSWVRETRRLQVETRGGRSSKGTRFYLYKGE